MDHRALFVAWLLLSLVNFHLFASDQRLLVSYMGILATACGISVSLMSLQDGCTSRPSWGEHLQISDLFPACSMQVVAGCMWCLQELSSVPVP